jgi:hypothetical protein
LAFLARMADLQEMMGMAQKASISEQNLKPNIEN